MKIVWITFFVLGIPLILWIGWGLYVIITTERPSYDVKEKLSSQIEIRQYEEQHWISTSLENDNTSFMELGSYIFGKNETGEKVAMTAPVITDDKMTFILPEGVSPQNAPAPAGQRIDFTTVAPRTIATLQFSGYTRPERVANKEARLLDTLRKKGIETIGTPFLMRYNDPATPPFLRRNEVAIEVVPTLP